MPSSSTQVRHRELSADRAVPSVAAKREKRPPARPADAARSKSCLWPCCSSSKEKPDWDAIVRDLDGIGKDLDCCGKHAFCDLACEPLAHYIVRGWCHSALPCLPLSPGVSRQDETQHHCHDDRHGTVII